MKVRLLDLVWIPRCYLLLRAVLKLEPVFLNNHLHQFSASCFWFYARGCTLGVQFLLELFILKTI